MTLPVYLFRFNFKTIRVDFINQHQFFVIGHSSASFGPSGNGIQWVIFIPPILGQYHP